MTLFDLRKKRDQAHNPSYPQTRELFLFVREVVAAQKGVHPAALLDADVGATLEYDYKYTHQWRFGKKRMLDTSELEELADNIDVDFDILQKIAIGIWDADLALYVYRLRLKKENVHIKETIKFAQGEIDLEFDVPPSRVDTVKAELKNFKEKVKKISKSDSEKISKDRRAEIMGFENFIEDFNLPRIAFYRKVRKE